MPIRPLIFSGPESRLPPQANPELISVDAALATVLARCSPLAAQEVALEGARGRYLADALPAPAAMPLAQRGSEALTAGLALGAAQIGAAAALGRATVPCAGRPSVAVLTTGSELRPGGEPLAPGQIYNSNAPLLRALAASAGAEATVIPAAADTWESHRAALEQALDHDVALSSGGVSVGGHDLVRQVLAELEVNELFWRIAMKPGKPISFGVRERKLRPVSVTAGAADAPRPTLVFGLPGNPVSVLVCFEMFVRPALRALQGALDPGPAFRPGRLSAPVRADPQREQVIGVRLTSGGLLEPLTGHRSHQLTAMASAHGLARIAAGEATLAAGAKVDYVSLADS